MSYLEMAEKALGQRRQLAGSQSQEVVALRKRLAELRQRIDKGFEVLRAREEANNTAHPYPLWLQTWDNLLRDYGATADRLAILTGSPIGECSRFETCTVRPTTCPAVTEKDEECANGSLDRGTLNLEQAP